MTSLVVNIFDLGPGDGGKGGVVHAVTRKYRAHTVIKVGGAQGSHGVRTSAGESFAFSQWGCGTFEGVRTHISHRLVVSPEGLLNEGRMLQFEHGVHDPFDLLTVDGDALCANAFHGIASHIKELSLGKSPRGTIGTGVGEAYRCSASHPELDIRVRDLSRPDIRDRLAAQRERVIADLAPFRQAQFLPDDRQSAAEEWALLDDPGLLDHLVGCYRTVASLANIVDRDYLGRVILAREGVAVIESSHGVLTDSQMGFHPHTSAIRTLPRFAREMVEEAGYDGRIATLAVHRAYEIRHGAGPMPTAEPEMGESLLPGSNKEENRWQGRVRVGPLDLVLMRYALACAGGPRAIDGLAITWFDQIVRNGEWKLCDHYAEGSDDREFFDSAGEIAVHFGEGPSQQARQERLGSQLLSCRPKISAFKIDRNADSVAHYGLCASALRERLDIPVRLVSLGPTELDKVMK